MLVKVLCIQLVEVAVTSVIQDIVKGRLLAIMLF